MFKNCYLVCFFGQILMLVYKIIVSESRDLNICLDDSLQKVYFYHQQFKQYPLQVQMNQNHDTRPEMEKIMNEIKSAQTQAHQASASKTQNNFNNNSSPHIDELRQKRHDIPKLVFSKTMTPILSPQKIEIGQDGIDIVNDVNDDVDDYPQVMVSQSKNIKKESTNKKKGSSKSPIKQMIGGLRGAYQPRKTQENSFTPDKMMAKNSKNKNRHATPASNGNSGGSQPRHHRTGMDHVDFQMPVVKEQIFGAEDDIELRQTNKEIVDIEVTRIPLQSVEEPAESGESLELLFQQNNFESSKKTLQNQKSAQIISKEDLKNSVMTRKGDGSSHNSPDRQRKFSLSPTPEKLNNNLKRLITDRKKFQSDSIVMAKTKSQSTKLYGKVADDKSLKLLKGLKRGQTQTMKFADQSNNMFDESSQSLLDIQSGQSQNVRFQKSRRKPFEKYPISRIDREFTQLKKQERLQNMSKFVKNIFQKNQDYFQGKEVQFENNASYSQCLKNPNRENSYILVQDSKMNYDNDENLAIPHINDEMKLFDPSESQIIKYVTASNPMDNNMSDRDNQNGETHTLISFWSQDSNSQYRCEQIIKEYNLIKCVVNQEKDFGQVLYTGQTDETFFFSQNDQQQLYLNIIDLETTQLIQQDHLSPVRRSPTKTGKNNPIQEKKFQTITRFLIAEGSSLEEQVLYQLQIHKQKPIFQFGLPKPTMVKLENIQYLVITVLDEMKPSISFFEISAGNAPDDNISSSDDDGFGKKVEVFKQIQGELSFQIEGAEIFLQSDNKDNVYFLTNERLLNSDNSSYDLTQERELNYSRLVAQSLVKMASLEQLRQLRTIQLGADDSVDEYFPQVDQEQVTHSTKRKVILDEMKTWNLSIDTKSMNFFRSQSHQYPYVQAIYNLKMNSLALQFYGSENQKSTGLHFELLSTTQQPNKNQIINIKTSKLGFSEKNSQQTSQFKETQLKGHFINEEEEEVRVSLKIVAADATCDEISPDSSGVQKNGKTFLIEQETLRYEWVHEKWFTSQSQHRQPFQIKEIEFDPDTGDIISGQATLEGSSKKVTLVSALDYLEVNEQKDIFSGERQFKLNFMYGNVLKATIEGAYINMPFNQVLVGNFKRHEQPDKGGESARSVPSKRSMTEKAAQHNTSFMISKRSMTKLSFDDGDGIEEFYVEIQNGKVTDQSKMIYLLSDLKTGQIFQDVHQIVTNSQGIFILNGSLKNLQSSSTKKLAQDQNQDDSAFKITQFSSTQKGKLRSINKKDFLISNAQTLKMLIQQDQLKNQDCIIQGFSVSQTQELNFCVLETQIQGNSTVNFVQDSLKQSQKTSGAIDQDLIQKDAQNLTAQSWMVDYPLIAYNSHLPDNSQILLQNFAVKENFQQVLNLGQWQFLCFVQSVCLSQTFEDLNPFHCQILFLAKHTKLHKVRLMVLDQDPWCDKRGIELSVINTCEIKLPPIQIEKVKSVNLLTQKDSSLDIEMALVFQYTDVMWSVSLQQVGQVSQVFDHSQMKVMPRHATRRLNDTAHIYCIVEYQQKSQIVKIYLSGSSQNQGTAVKFNDIYDGQSSKILIVEPDPYCLDNLLVIEDEQKFVKISDVGEGKANIVSTLDLSHHKLEDELALFKTKPWTSMTISDRMLTLDDFIFSMDTKFYWQDQKIKEDENLIEKRNLLGTLQSIQLQKLSNGKTVFRCQPLPCSNLVDLMGQSRTNENTNLYFATNDKVLMQIENGEDNRILIFDVEGYHLNEQNEDLSSFNQILLESTESQEYGKFFLLKNSEETYALMQSNKDSQLKIQKFSIDYLKEKVIGISQENLAEMIKSETDVFEDVLNEVTQEIKESLVIHEEKMMITKTGELILLASAVVTAIDQSLTIFQNHEAKQEKVNRSLTNMISKSISQSTEAKPNLEETSGYQYSQNLFGIYKNKQINILLILCPTQHQQDSLSSDLRYRQSVNTTELGKQAKQKLFGSVSREGTTRLHQQKRKIQALEQKQEHFTFGIVDNKLIWLTFQRKFIEHIDLDDLIQASQEKPNEFIWDTLKSSGFPVNGILSDFTLEDLKTKGLEINEIAEESLLRKKEIEEKNESLNLMQLTVGNNATVYSLKSKEWKEVTLMRDIDEFENPIVFNNTGYEYRTQECTFQTNSSQTYGLQRPFPSEKSRGLYRAFSEMDICQVQSILKVCRKKSNLTKADIGDIESRLILSQFEKESLFTIFAEHQQIYDLILDRLTSLKQTLKREDSQKVKEINHYLRAMYLIITKPTPISVRWKIDQIEKLSMGHIKANKIIEPTYLSILKQSLLFEESRATISLFQIAEILGISITDYILCISDLKIIIEKLPSQLYKKLLSSMDENAYTMRQKEAIMAKRGINARLSTFIQNSAIISENTPELDVQRIANEDEVKIAVQICVLPLQWIKDDDGSSAVLFTFFRDNLEKLQGSLLLDSLFDAFWNGQQNQILRFVFYPYLVYFMVALYYYYECMLIQSGHNVGIVSRVCSLFDRNSKADCELSESHEPIFRIIFLILISHQFFIEIFQLEKDGFWKYMKQRSNKIDNITIFLNFLVVIMMTANEDMYRVRPIASMAVVFLWIQMFFWFRLFDSLAQYVDLILMTAYDIRYFMYVLFSLVLMFTSGIYLIQVNRMQQPEEIQQLVFPFTENQGSLFMESTFYMYKMILGDWSLFIFERNSIGFDDSGWIEFEGLLVLAYFIGATFVTQIVVLNMLIAIMGQTFSNHNEDLYANAKRQKLVLQAEFTELVEFYQEILRRCKKLCCKRRSANQEQDEQVKSTENYSGYLFMIIPTEQNEEDVDSGVSKADQSQLLQQVLDEKFRDQEIYNKKVLKGIQDLTQDTKNRLNGIEKSNQDRYESLKDEFQLKFNKLRQEIKGGGGKRNPSGEAKRVNFEPTTQLDSARQNQRQAAFARYSKETNSSRYRNASEDESKKLSARRQ